MISQFLQKSAELDGINDINVSDSEQGQGQDSAPENSLDGSWEDLTLDILVVNFIHVYHVYCIMKKLIILISFVLGF